MLTLLVYLFEGNYYVILLGGTEGFQGKEDVFITGKEEEAFTVTHQPGSPFLETLRQLIAEADKRGIKDIRTMETIFSGGKARDLEASSEDN